MPGLAYEEWNDLTLDEMRERLRGAPDDAAILELATGPMPSRTPQEAVQCPAEAAASDLCRIPQSDRAGPGARPRARERRQCVAAAGDRQPADVCVEARYRGTERSARKMSPVRR